LDRSDFRDDDEQSHPKDRHQSSCYEYRTFKGLKMRKLVVHGWDFIFNHKVSPLRHIQDVAIRHYVLQALGFMWAVSFSIAIGSYTTAFANIIGHAVLIGAVGITVATYTAAKLRPAMFTGSGRRRDGEHE
jgi:hypothetical protein